MKPLDFVKTPRGNIAIITETTAGGTKASVMFLGGQKTSSEKSAWWDETELEVIDNLPRLLGYMSADMRGDGYRDVERVFGIAEKK